MEIDDISTSDCKIEYMLIENNEIKIIFQNVYDMKNKNYVENVCIIINNWKKIICREYITKSSFGKGYWKQSEQIKHFEIIQEIEKNNEEIILRGFCKETGNWMEYIIEKYEIKILNKLKK
jgi:hypothetical protein